MPEATITNGTTNGTNPQAPVPDDFLIRGGDYLKKHPGFSLKGRDAELVDISNILMQRSANNLILTGPAGVGLTALAMGLQESKDKPNTPFDIVGKRFYWLQTAALFSNGGEAAKENFKKVLATLTKPVDTVLIIEDIRDFLAACRDNNCSNLVYALMEEVNNGKFQCIWETRDKDLPEVIAAHGDVRELFTVLDIKEPSKDKLYEIINSVKSGLEAYHGIPITPEAVNVAIDMTQRYRSALGSDRAQPDRAITLLDRALTAYRQEAHTSPRGLAKLETDVQLLDNAINGGGKVSDFEDKTPEELQALKAAKLKEIADLQAGWEKQQSKIRALYSDQRKGEERVREIEQTVQEQREVAARDLKKAQEDAKNQPQPASNKPSVLHSFSSIFQSGSSFSDTQEIRDLLKEKGEIEGDLKTLKTQYDAHTSELNKGLSLTTDDVRKTFSRISGIPANKLGQNEADKLMHLEETLSARVTGQDAAVKALARAVRRARAGLKKPNKPVGSFLFVGSSGVGKTELAKALTVALYEDERAMNRFDMGEYMEKSSVAGLTGSPPGYVGYDEGGALTTPVRDNPACVNLFDEIEKAHKDINDVFLAVIDDGRLTDKRGFTAEFNEAVNIFTTNIGAENFLREDITFDEASVLALEELRTIKQDPRNPERTIGFRQEFLNRFDSIICFNRLGIPQIVWIAEKQMKDLNGWAKDSGLAITMDHADVEAMCKDRYIPREGARGIEKYIAENITSEVADRKIQNLDSRGTVTVHYHADTKSVTTDFTPEAPDAVKPAALTSSATQVNPPVATRTIQPANNSSGGGTATAPASRLVRSPVYRPMMS